MFDADDFPEDLADAEVVVEAIYDMSLGDPDPNYKPRRNWKDFIPHFFVMVTALAIITAIVALIDAVIKS